MAQNPKTIDTYSWYRFFNGKETKLSIGGEAAKDFYSVFLLPNSVLAELDFRGLPDKPVLYTPKPFKVKGEGFATVMAFMEVRDPMGQSIIDPRLWTIGVIWLPETNGGLVNMSYIKDLVYSQQKFDDIWNTLCRDRAIASI